MALTLLILTLVMSAVIGVFLVTVGLTIVGCLIAWVLDHFGFFDEDVYIEINRGRK